jgi:hypothetical protein
MTWFARSNDFDGIGRLRVNFLRQINLDSLLTHLLIEDVDIFSEMPEDSINPDHEYLGCPATYKNHEVFKKVIHIPATDKFSGGRVKSETAFSEVLLKVSFFSQQYHRAIIHNWLQWFSVITDTTPIFGTVLWNLVDSRLIQSYLWASNKRNAEECIG